MFGAWSWLKVLVLLWVGLGQCAVGVAQSKQRPSKPQPLSTVEIAARLRKSLVVVSTLDSKGDNFAEGSGFFINPTTVVTNVHVLKRGSEATVKTLVDGVTHKVAGVSAFSLNHDLCILDVPDAEGSALLLSSVPPSVGDEILAGGNPEGLEASITKGMISAVRTDQGLIQIDAPISHGSSGGPVVNQRGDVIGVASSSLIEGQNLNFAIPAAFLRDGLLHHRVTVRQLGRLAVTSWENEEFRGPVKRVIESSSTDLGASSVDPGSLRPRVTTSIRHFNRDGRLIEQDYYTRTGVPDGKQVYEYDNDGLIKRITTLDNNGVLNADIACLLDECISMYASGPQFVGIFDESSELREKDGSVKEIQTWDLQGHEVKIEFLKSDIKHIFNYDPQGREVENQVYEKGKQLWIIRFTYETNSHGDWVTGRGAVFYPRDPTRGYPDSISYREITYY